jgi:hypothetical protein
VLGRRVHLDAGQRRDKGVKRGGSGMCGGLGRAASAMGDIGVVWFRGG